MNFRQFLNNCVKNGEPIFFDGGMGTMLQSSAAANYSIPEEVNFPLDICNLQVLGFSRF